MRIALWVDAARSKRPVCPTWREYVLSIHAACAVEARAKAMWAMAILRLGSIHRMAPERTASRVLRKAAAICNDQIWCVLGLARAYQTGRSVRETVRHLPHRVGRRTAVHRDRRRQNVSHVSTHSSISAWTHDRGTRLAVGAMYDQGKPDAALA